MGKHSAMMMRSIATRAQGVISVLALSLGCLAQDRAFQDVQEALLAWPSSHSTEPAPRHVRVLNAWHEDGKRARLVLQTATRSLVHPQTKKELVLVSMFAVGTAEYFRSADVLLQRFGQHILVEDTVPESLTEPHFVVCMRRHMRALAQCTGLALQDSWMAQVRFPWQTVDLAIEVRAKYWAELASFNDALTERAKEFEAALRLEPDSPLVRMARDRAMQVLVSEAMARDLPSDTHSDLAKRREATLFDALAALVKKRDVERLAIVYNARNTEQIERRVARELGFRVYATSWRDVFSYDYSPQVDRGSAERK